jgi:hypothetical protein
MIATLTDLEAELTVHKVTGDIDIHRLVSTLKILQETATRLVLWDLREATNIGSSSTAKVESITPRLKDIPVLPGGKAAFVFASETDYGMGRMYEAYAKMENLSFELAMFQSLSEAETWLRS